MWYIELAIRKVCQRPVFQKLLRVSPATISHLHSPPRRLALYDALRPLHACRANSLLCPLIQPVYSRRVAYSLDDIHRLLGLPVFGYDVQEGRTRELEMEEGIRTAGG